MPVDAIRIEGMRQLRRELRRASSEMPRRVAEVNRRVAERVREKAEARRQFMPYGSYRRVKLGRSGTTRSAAVTVGPAAFAGAAEFGMDMHPVFGRWRRASSMRRRVWPRWSGNQWTEWAQGNVGYMVHPAIRALRAEIEDTYLTEVFGALEEAA